MLSGSLPEDAANNATNTILLLIAAFVVEHTKFSPDTHTHTLSLSLSLKYHSTLAACFCTNYIIFGNTEIFKTSFSQRTNFFVKEMKNILKYLEIF